MVYMKANVNKGKNKISITFGLNDTEPAKNSN